MEREEKRLEDFGDCGKRFAGCENCLVVGIDISKDTHNAATRSTLARCRTDGRPFTTRAKVSRPYRRRSSGKGATWTDRSSVRHGTDGELSPASGVLNQWRSPGGLGVAQAAKKVRSLLDGDGRA